MSRFSRCDGCRAEIPLPLEGGWLLVVHAEDDPRCDVHTLSFCGWACLGQYATARTLLDGVADQGQATP